jgi:GMP synthase (glutamine-hydrolysing)
MLQNDDGPMAPLPPLSPAPRVVVVQHVAEEGLGLLGEVLAERAIAVDWVRPTDELPRSRLEEASGLVVLGGPMGVYESDRHPRLVHEMRAIEAALERRLPLLGICLGSQLLASVLGASVRPSQHLELGWHDVALAPEAASDPLFVGAPRRFSALHWHGDVFDRVAGATHLARSAATDHQAFSFEDRAWGLLFHLEVDLAQIARMAAAFPADVVAANLTAEGLVDESRARLPGLEPIARALFERWASRLDAPPRAKEG